MALTKPITNYLLKLKWPAQHVAAGDPAKNTRGQALAKATRENVGMRF